MRRCFFFFFQAEDGIRDLIVTGVQTCALPISSRASASTVLSSANIFCSEKRLTTLVTYSRPATRRIEPRVLSCCAPPRRRAISSARIFSRSRATRLMRCFIETPPRPSSEKPNVKTTAAAAIAASAAIMKSRVKICSIAPASEVELDHAVHHEAADPHQHRGDAEPDQTDGGREQRNHVAGRRERHEDRDDERQRADDTGGGLGFRRHRLDLLLHLLAVA